MVFWFDCDTSSIWSIVMTLFDFILPMMMFIVHSMMIHSMIHSTILFHSIILIPFHSILMTIRSRATLFHFTILDIICDDIEVVSILERKSYIVEDERNSRNTSDTILNALHYLKLFWLFTAIQWCIIEYFWYSMRMWPGSDIHYLLMAYFIMCVILKADIRILILMVEASEGSDIEEAIEMCSSLLYSSYYSRIRKYKPISALFCDWKYHWFSVSILPFCYDSIDFISIVDFIRSIPFDPLFVYH